jgi:glucoamylase
LSITWLNCIRLSAHFLKITVPVFTVLFAFSVPSLSARAGTVEIKNNQLHIDGRPQPQLWGAEIQYFRLRGGPGRNIPREEVLTRWARALDSAREANMNAISFYIPWDFHEYAEGKFDFDGTVDEDGDGNPDYPSRDIRTFIRMIKERGIRHIMARPGPFINAEWGFLGFGAIPLWFHEKYPNSHARNPKSQRTTLYNYHDADFLRHSQNWLKTVYDNVLREQIGPGRPVSFIQIDNETNLMWQSAYNHDYGPQALDRYRDFLKNTYGSIESLNSAHRRFWNTWNEVTPPTRPAENKFEDLDWYRFQDFSMYEYLKKIRAIWTNLGVTEPSVLFTLAESYNAPENGILPNYKWRNSKDTGMMTVNLYPKTYETPDKTLMNLPFKADHDVKAADSASDYYLGSRQEWLLGPEIQGGWWRGIHVSEESRRQTYLTTLGHGLKALFIYYFNEGDNWQQDWMKRAITPYYAELKNLERYRNIAHENLPETFWNELQDQVANRFLVVDVRGVWRNGGTFPERLYFDAPLGPDAEKREPYRLVRELGEKVFSKYGEFLAGATALEDPVCVIKDSEAHAPSLVSGVNSRTIQSDWNAGLLGVLMQAGVNARIHHLGLTSSSELLDQSKCKLIIYQDTGFAKKDLVTVLTKALNQGTNVLSFIHTDLVNQIMGPRRQRSACSPIPHQPMNVEGYRCQVTRGLLYHARVPIYDVFNTDFYFLIHDVNERRGVFENFLREAGITPHVKIRNGGDRTVTFARLSRDQKDVWITIKTSQRDGFKGSIQWTGADSDRLYEITDVLTGHTQKLPGTELANSGFMAELAASGSTAFYVKESSEYKLEDWIKTQRKLSEERLLQNISPPDAVRGTVIASPSRSNPDYYFHWTRDAALVMNTVVELHKTSPTSEIYLSKIEDYVELSLRQQSEPGSEGLGEPRYRIDGRADTLPWGRPQYDGPALRALTLLRFLESLADRPLSRRENSLKERSLNVVRTDLEYVIKTWRLPCFDLWEELRGLHFYTQSVQFSSLKNGSLYFSKIREIKLSERLALESESVRAQLEKYWDPGKKYILASLEHEERPGMPNYKDENLDTSVILAALHSRPSTGMLSFTSDKLVATAGALETAFSKEYKINHGQPVPAIGRFTDDIYFGGNPWYLTTAAFAEFYYRIGKRQQGDAYLEILRKYAGENGAFSEQFDRNTGQPISAQNLTWSYAALLSAIAAR